MNSAANRKLDILGIEMCPIGYFDDVPRIVFSMPSYACADGKFPLQVQVRDIQVKPFKPWPYCFGLKRQFSRLRNSNAHLALILVSLAF